MLSDQTSFWRTIKPFINSRNNENTGSIKLKDNDETDETINTFFTSASDINEDSNNTVRVLIYHSLLKTCQTNSKTNPTEACDEESKDK